MPYDLSEAFEAIEDELIGSMIRNLKRHQAEETDQGFEWEQWQALQLKALEEYRKNNAKKFPPRFSKLNEQIEEALRTSHSNGAADQEQKILRAIQDGFTSPKQSFSGNANIEGDFFRTNDRKLDALITATTRDMERAEYAVLRRADDQYRQVIFNAQVYANTGAGTYKKAVDMATRDFLRAGLDSIEYKNGSRHTIEDYADMAIRTAGKRAYLQGEGAMRDEWGVPTVIMNKRSCPCPKCAPFVGKVFIDDVWSGGDSSGISPVTGVKYPLLSEAIEQGLYHPRCRDVHTTYFEGVNTPPEDSQYTADELDEMAQRYEAQQKQGYCQRQEKRYDRMSKYSLDEENQRMYGARAKEWSNKAEDFKKAVESFEKSDKKAVETVEKSGGSGIIRSRKDSSDSKIDWLQKGEQIPTEDFKNIRDYAREKGIQLQGFKKSDVDVELIKETIDSMSKVLDVFPELKGNDKKSLTLIWSEVMSADDFAMTEKGIKHVIKLNGDAFRNKKKLAEEYSKLEKIGWFAKGTTYKSIPQHELGHLYQDIHNISDEKILEIAVNSAKVENRKALFKFLEKGFSRYSSLVPDGSEIISEVFSDYFGNKNPTKFSKDFMNELMKLR